MLYNKVESFILKRKLDQFICASITSLIIWATHYLFTNFKSLYLRMAMIFFFACKSTQLEYRYFTCNVSLDWCSLLYSYILSEPEKRHNQCAPGSGEQLEERKISG